MHNVTKSRLCREAVRLGHAVRYVGAIRLISALAIAQGQLSLKARLTQYTKSRPLMIDELGYLPLETKAA